MTLIGALLALLTEVIRLIDRAGSVSKAAESLKSVNDTFVIVEQAKTPTEYQDAAKAVSNLESDT